MPMLFSEDRAVVQGPGYAVDSTRYVEKPHLERCKLDLEAQRNEETESCEIDWRRNIER